MREVTPDADRQPVVIGYRTALDLLDSSIVGIRSCRRQRPGRIDSVRVIGVVKAIGVRNLNAVISDIVHYQRCRRIQLLLELQVPLLPLRGMNGAVQSRECRRRKVHAKWHQGSCDLRVGLATDKAGIKGLCGLSPLIDRTVGAGIKGQRAVRRPDTNRDRNRRIAKRTVGTIHQASRRTVVEETEAAADYSLAIAVRRPTEADAG